MRIIVELLLAIIKVLSQYFTKIIKKFKQFKSQKLNFSEI